MNYYEILEISTKASQEVIKMAYKALVKKYHPDVYQGDKVFAESHIKKINEAYDVLSDPIKKSNYDLINNISHSKTNQSAPDENNTEKTVNTNSMNNQTKSSSYDYSENSQKTTNDNSYYSQSPNTDTTRNKSYGCAWLLVGLVITIIIFAATNNSNSTNYNTYNGQTYTNNNNVQTQQQTQQIQKISLNVPYFQVEGLLGKPDYVFKYTFAFFVLYGDSYIIIDNNNSVAGWEMKTTDIKVDTPSQVPDFEPFIGDVTDFSKYITLGSTAEQVKNILGSPSKIENLSFQDDYTWYFGDSSIVFNKSTNKVIAWNQGGTELKISLGEWVGLSGVFTLGSTPDQVSIIMGTPNKIENLSFQDDYTWFYGTTSVIFSKKTNKVIAWEQGDTTLFVNIGNFNKNAEDFTLGSTPDQVSTKMGTPNKIENLSFEDDYTWFYGTTSIKFSKKTNKVIAWEQGDTTLYAKIGIFTKESKGITIGSTFEQVANVMGTPNKIENLSFEDDYTWFYGTTSIKFNKKTNKVIAWEQGDTPLKLQ